ncbi:hypothetical protein BDW69DRAFT_119004 [Aspergillus filifer]
MASKSSNAAGGGIAAVSERDLNWESQRSQEIREHLQYKMGLMKCRMMGLLMPPQTSPPCPPLSAKPCLSSATAKSAFFQRLPSEIRRCILLEAFGGRIIHFDFRLMYPRNESRLAQVSYCPCFGDESISLGRDTAKPLQWEWCNTVCNRETIDTDCIPTEHDFLNKWYRYRKPWLPLYQSLPDHMHDECTIGALGWLQTCRQAYIEGFEVLYSTNRLRIDEENLVRWLPNLLLSRQRAMIRSVQLAPMIALWPPHEQPEDAHDHNAQFGIYCDLRKPTLMLEALPKVLPHLQSLHISFGGHFELSNLQKMPQSEYHEWLILASEEVFDLVDATVMKLSQNRLSHCRVYIPSNLFDMRKTMEQLHTGTSFWRSLPGVYERETLSPCDKKLDRHQLEGYWICRGEYEDRY